MKVTDWFEAKESSWVKRVGLLRNGGPSDSGIVVEVTDGRQYLYLDASHELWLSLRDRAGTGDSVGAMVNGELKGRFQERVLAAGTVGFEAPAPLDLVASGLVNCTSRGWPFS